jgi:hypothetical protein
MSDFDQLQKFEIQPVKNLAKLLRDQLDDRSLADLFESCKDRGKKAARAVQKSRERQLVFLMSVYETGLQVLANDEDEEFRAMLKHAGIRAKRGTHPFASLVLLAVGKNAREKASRIASGLRFAAFQETLPEDFAAFIKKHHGISGCAECWRKLRNEKAALSQDREEVKEEGKTEPDEKESQDKKDENDNTGLAFDEDSKEDFGKLLARRKKLFLRLRANLSRKGLLTVTKVSVDKHKTEHGKKQLKDVRKLTKRSRMS